jgi:tight adherence protein C
MIMLLIIGLTLLAFAVATIARVVIDARTRPVGTLTQIERYGFGAAAIDVQDDSRERRSVDRLASNIGHHLGKRLSWFKEEEVRTRLVSAGMYTVTPNRLLGYQVMLAVAFLCLWLWVAGISGVATFWVVVLAIALTALGFFVPMGYVNIRTVRRRDAIEYDLPEAIDLLVVSVEAGVSLPGAIRLAGREMGGALGEELRLTLQEQNMGLSTSEALENLGVRADTPGTRIFVRSLVQGEQLGMSIGQVLRNLALEMRKRRKAAAEERAQKAPIKMIFPLVLLIFPAMLVVLVVPALIRIADVLG